MKILIVDDNPHWRQIFRCLLQESDTVIECDNGDEAVGAYALHKPDLTLMEIEMSGVSGLASGRR